MAAKISDFFSEKGSCHLLLQYTAEDFSWLYQAYRSIKNINMELA